MRPRDVPSKWVKVRPWYYTQRRQPTRATVRSEAIARELRDSGTTVTSRSPAGWVRS